MSTSAQAHCLRAVLIRRAPDSKLPVGVRAPAHESAARHEGASMRASSRDCSGSETWCVFFARAGKMTNNFKFGYLLIMCVHTKR